MATPNPFITVTPKQWMDRTKVSGIAFRSGTLKKIDNLYAAAYTNYLNVRVLNHSQQEFRDTVAKLLSEFNRYLLEHNASPNWTGADGKDLHRNELSAGLMKQTYDFIREFLGPQKNTPGNDARHTRAGVLFLLGHTQPSINMWSLASAAVSVGTASAAPVWTSQSIAGSTYENPAMKLQKLTIPLQIKQGSSTVDAPTPVNPRATMFDKVVQMVEGIVASIKKFLAVKDATYYSVLGKLIRNAVDYIVKILTKAAPVVGTAIDITQGFIKVCSAAIDYLTTRSKRGQFMLVSGHPALLADRIEQGMKSDVTDGLLQMCKGAATLAFGAFTAGVGQLIVEAVIAVVNFFRSFFEMKKIEAFCQKAQVELSKLQSLGYNLKDAEANKGKSFGKLVDEADEFRLFYQEGVNASITIPILTLNSGICGDLMQMVRMYDTSNKVISQESFDAATVYFQRLKLWGGKHIQKSGIRFTSHYQNVQNLLYHAVNGHQGMQSTGQKIMTIAAG